MRSALTVFRALGDPTRLRILALVARMELAVGELAEVLGQSQPRVSRHIKILAEAGLIERAKEGAWVFLRASHEPHAAPLCALMTALKPDGAALERDLARLTDVRSERQAAAQAWFAAHAAEWDGLRSLHTAESEVETAILAALGARPVGRLVDIGTGTGRMIELLGAHSSSAIGIDRSPEMLRLARVKIAAIGGAEVRQGDMAALPLADGAADTVVLHQVLHFAADPARALAEAARVLAPGGRLLVIDFAPHAREELRSTQGHARLGFADETVIGWLRGCGLNAAVAGRLAGPELTVTLWLGERPADALRIAA
ncbi:MAG: metalloregulator ArsR/SmtB family transcription factor [Sphingomonadaceae bacterium]|nr:metalloregulator ArsR/SmtB family transcription factor [Sphingomonadaceae bacterium]